MNKLLKYLFVVTAVFLLYGCEDTRYYNEAEKVKRLSKQIDEMEITISKHYRGIDTNSVLKGFSRKMIDTSMTKIIPKNILDTLFKRYPSYYIPNPKRYYIDEFKSFSNNNYPFYINGDFNSDGVTDHAFILETCFIRKDIKDLFNECILVVLYSKKTNTNNVFYEAFSHDIYYMGRGGIETKVMKVNRGVKYDFHFTKYEAQSDKILLISWGTDVGEVVEWSDSKFIVKQLWNAL